MTRESYEAFVGPKNGIYYLAKFDAIERRGGGARATWNWPAFLFNAVWALYRKMYGWFFVFWGVAFVSSIIEKAGSPGISALIIVASMVLFGLYANAIYYRRAKRTIAEVSTAVDEPSKRITYLRAKGGVHVWAPWVFISIPAVGILAAVLLPLFQDRPIAKFSQPREDVTGGAPEKETKASTPRREPSQAAIDWLREAAALEAKDNTDYQGQLRIAKTFVSREPTNDFAWTVLGHAHGHLDQTEKALEAYAHAIKLDSSAVGAWAGRGRLYSGMKQFDRAEEAFKRVLAISPDDVDNLEKLGILFHIKGDKLGTVNVYQKLRTQDQSRAAKFFESYVVP